MSTFPVAKFMSHDCENFVTMLLMLLEKRLSNYDLVELKTCVGMQVVVVLDLKPDLLGIKTFSGAHLVDFFS